MFLADLASPRGNYKSFQLREIDVDRNGVAQIFDAIYWIFFEIIKSSTFFVCCLESTRSLTSTSPLTLRIELPS